MGKKGSIKNLIAIAVCFVLLAVSVGLLVDRLLTKAAGPSTFVPVMVTTGRSFNLAIDVEGYLWAWGANDLGKLGDGTTTNRHEPTRHNNIHYDRKYVAIAAEYHSLAIDTDGYLWAWGSNSNGRLGDGTTTHRYSPVRQNGAHFNRKYTAVAAGGGCSYALDTDGYLWVWGANDKGQLGDGTTTESLEPKRQSGVHASRKYTSIVAGNGSCYAIDTDGYLWVWGYNSSGQLGDGTQTNSLEPIRQNGAHGMRKYNSLSADGHVLALDEDGYIWVWGTSFNGRLGIGSTGGGTPVLEPMRHLGTHADRKYTAVSAGTTHSHAIDEDGYLWAWGWGYDYALGIGNNLQRIEPVRYSDPLSEHYSRKYSSISNRTHGLAFDSEGYLWAWGGNSSGSIGDGTTTASNSPIQISFIKPTFDPGGDPITPDPYDPKPSKPAPVKRDREPISIDEEILLYALFGAGMLVLIALLVVSYTQRDRKPKKRVTIYEY